MRRSVGLGLVVLIAGCGTVTRTVTAPSGARAPSKAQFIAQADRICSSAQAQVRPVLARLDEAKRANDHAEAAAGLLTAAAANDRVYAKLRALPAPAGDRAVLNRIFDAGTSEATDARNLAQALTDQDPQVTNAAIQTDNQAQAYYAGLALGYGFKRCAGS